MTKKFLYGIIDTYGYVIFRLVEDSGKSKNIKSHAIIGSLFYGLKLNRTDDEINITMDHIDKIKVHNYECNLRPATKSEQARNRNQPSDRKGKIVLKLSSDGEIIKEYMSVTLAAVDANICYETMSRYCENEEILNGFRYRFKTKEDMTGHTWKSSKELYPHILPPIDVSNKGWIYTLDKTLTKGTNHGLYLEVIVFDTKKRKRVHIYVHILVWTVFNNRVVPKGYQISHEDCEGTNNCISNLKIRTREGPDGNLMVTVKNGKYKSAIRVRKHFHDGSFVDYPSINAAGKANKGIKGGSFNSIRRALKRENKAAGLCKCKKKFTWEIISS
uniref:HNH endonuclease n=1 Tax=Pithovirus LCPAC403 TaxID=2506596 RepID=A0A481ZCP1_9VIRU|nr:MAG: HNH endonuclease [Pithovirus LCPAC403]